MTDKHQALRDAADMLNNPYTGSIVRLDANSLASLLADHDRMRDALIVIAGQGTSRIAKDALKECGQ